MKIDPRIQAFRDSREERRQEEQTIIKIVKFLESQGAWIENDGRFKLPYGYRIMIYHQSEPYHCIKYIWVSHEGLQSQSSEDKFLVYRSCKEYAYSGKDYLNKK